MIATKLRSSILKKPFNPAHNESEQNQYPIAYAANHGDDGETKFDPNPIEEQKPTNYPKPMLLTTAMMAKTV
jgi:hypothetical protein